MYTIGAKRSNSEIRITEHIHVNVLYFLFDNKILKKAHCEISNNYFLKCNYIIKMQ